MSGDYANAWMKAEREARALSEENARLRSEVAALTQAREDADRAWSRAEARAEAAEAALATTRQALEEIAHPVGAMLTTPMSQDIARRALAATEEPS